MSNFSWFHLESGSANDAIFQNSPIYFSHQMPKNVDPVVLFMMSSWSRPDSFPILQHPVVPGTLPPYFACLPLYSSMGIFRASSQNFDSCTFCTALPWLSPLYPIAESIQRGGGSLKVLWLLSRIEREAERLLLTACLLMPACSVARYL